MSALFLIRFKYLNQLEPLQIKALEIYFVTIVNKNIDWFQSHYYKNTFATEAFTIHSYSYIRLMTGY